MQVNGKTAIWLSYSEHRDDRAASHSGKPNGTGGNSKVAMQEWDNFRALAGERTVGLHHNDLIVQQGVTQAKPAREAVVDGSLTHTQRAPQPRSHGLKGAGCVALEHDVDATLDSAECRKARLERAHVRSDEHGTAFAGTCGEIGRLALDVCNA